MENGNEKDKSHVKKTIGGGQLKDPSFLNKIARIIFTDDPMEAFRNWRKTKLVDNVKGTILEGASVFLYGQPINFKNGGTFISSSGRTPYNTFSNSTTPPSSALVSKPVTGGQSFNGTVYFESSQDESAYQRARNVYEAMIGIIAEYQWVSLAELYELADVTGVEYVNRSWGWSDLTGTQIYPSGKGYILQLPAMRTR